MTTRQFTFTVTAPPASALAAFAQNVTAGSVAEFLAPTLTQDDGSGSWPWQSAYFPPTYTDKVGILDWNSNLPFCPETNRFMVAGGRPASIQQVQKLIYYDVATNTWDSVVNPFSATGGHTYQSSCVATSIRRLFYVNISGDKVVRVWNTQAWSTDGTLPAIPALGGSSDWGDAICLVWHPGLGTQGKLLAMGSNGSGTWRCAAFDWANRAAGSAAWSLLFSITGTAATGAGLYGHMTGVYVPGATAAVMGAPAGRGLMVIKSDGSYYEASTSPVGINALSGRGILTPHPTKASAIFLSSSNNGSRIWELEIGASSATWVDRGVNPAVLTSLQQIGGTEPDLGVVFVVSGNGNFVGTKTYVYRPNF